MSLDQHCSELHKISTLVNAEVCMITCMRSHGAAASPQDEARTLAAGISQVALLIKPMQLAALELEMAAAWVA